MKFGPRWSNILASQISLSLLPAQQSCAKQDFVRDQRIGLRDLLGRKRPHNVRIGHLFQTEAKSSFEKAASHGESAGTLMWINDLLHWPGTSVPGRQCEGVES